MSPIYQQVCGILISFRITNVSECLIKVTNQLGRVWQIAHVKYARGHKVLDALSVDVLKTK